jgi:alkylation response protein AidB-like acyl-CoA dehydrogenase
MKNKFAADNNTLIKSLRKLAHGKIAPRAASYDQNPRFPKENFEDLHLGGFMAPTLSKAYGGLGLGHHSGNIHTLWEMTMEIARADMSLARCWEGHANSLVLLDQLGTEEQLKRWAPGIVDRGELWSAWSGEPLLPKPGEKKKFGTQVTEVPGGYLIEGNKVFCSGAPGVGKAILLVHLSGRGGARHSTAAPEGLLLLVADMSDPSISCDDTWWDPMGMKSSVSLLVKFDRTFIPHENLLGSPGVYLLDDWQTRFSPHYGATFMGGAIAAFDYTLEYSLTQQRENDPFVQQRIAKMAIQIETGKIWLRHVAHLWETGETEAAKLAGGQARYFLETLAKDVLENSIHACGARALIRPSALERIYRDLSFYVRHDNLDHILATIGKSVLGLSHDASFFKQAPTSAVTPDHSKENGVHHEAAKK